MGNLNTTERLAMPLVSRAKPLQMSSYSIVATAPTTLRIKTPTWRSTMQVFRSETSELLFGIKSPTMSTLMMLFTPDGNAVMSVKKKTRFYGATTAFMSSIIVKHAILTPLIVLVEFEDRLSGGLCRVLVEGNYYEKVCVVYLERGSPELPPVEKRENGGYPQYQAIGRIHRKSKHKEEYVEIAEGVDLALLLVLWLVRYNIEHIQLQIAVAF